MRPRLLVLLLGFVTMLGVGAALVQCASQPSAPSRDPRTMGPSPGPGYPAPGTEVPAPPPVEPEAFEVVGLLGPVERLDEMCLEPYEIHLDHTRCGADVPSSAPFFEGATVLEAPSDPFLEVRLAARNDYQVGQAAGHGLMRYHLGIRARQGWFFLPEFATTQEPDFGSHHEWLVIASMRLLRASDPAPLLLELVYWEKMSDDDRGTDENYGSSSKKIVLCGFASDARPRCTAPTLIAKETSVRRISTDAVLQHSQWKLDVRYGPHEVELVPAPGTEGAEVPRSLLGRHALDFDAAASDAGRASP